MNSEIRVSPARIADFPAAQRFYDACGYGGAAIQIHDFVVLAWQGNAIVGIGRLCNDGGFLCLRGMQVEANRRRRGIGSKILRRLSSQIGADTCYCLPYSHLVGFYARVGFEPIDDAMPEVLDQRLRGYLNRGLDITAMMKRTSQ
jgi:N-acetylglutamate synthase-like GNAT family acetyltransferase